ncbi:MAG: type II CRISPR-associated endonuclease Cas1 [Bacteroidales bacterium]|nr:type II CRISPR-associated endonuclease Cas1 [Bacteroidales bacterium]
MSKQTLVFDSPSVLSIKNGLLSIVREGREEVLKSLEDIQTIMIDHHSVSLTIPLLNRLSEEQITVVFCNERHFPQSMLMDLETNSLQTKYYRKQIEASLPLKKQIWKQVIEAKIINQSRLLDELFHCGDVLQKYYENVKSGDSTNREGVAANCYWKRLLGKSFIRDRLGYEPNNLLNYGYALLRSAMARALMDSGLMPTLGVFHRNYFNSFPLADDMMEPYRPFVDRKVMEFYSAGKKEIDKEFKVAVLGLFYSELKRDVLTKTTASLVNVYCQNSRIVYYPCL